MHHKLISKAIHAQTCDCTFCRPQRVLDMRRALKAAIAVAVPVYGLLLAFWTVTR